MIKKIRNDAGVTAIEFAFFAIPFVFLLIGMIEIGMMSTAATLLQGATDSSSRLIRTGQAQNAADPQALFEDKLCESVDLLIDCDNLVYEVLQFDESTGFGGLSENMGLINPTFDASGNFESDGFDPGGENSLVIVRVTYAYPLLSPFVGPFLSDDGKNTKLLMSTAIVQNEPYDF